MTVALPAVIVFGLVAALLLRYRQVRALEFVIVAMFGFFLATTGPGRELASFLASLFGHHAGTVPAPSPTPLPTPGKVIGS